VGKNVMPENRQERLVQHIENPQIGTFAEGLQI